jgi:hypothetical protein
MPVLVYRAHNLTRERIALPLAIDPTGVFGVLSRARTAEGFPARVGRAQSLRRIGP